MSVQAARSRVLVAGERGVAQCWVCSCTDDLACIGGCWWVEDPTGRGRPLCSNCVQAAIALDRIQRSLTSAGRPMRASELARRTGIDIVKLAGSTTSGSSLLDELVHLRHLERTNDPVVRYTLPATTEVTR